MYDQASPKFNRERNERTSCREVRATPVRSVQDRRVHEYPKQGVGVPI